MTRNVQSFLTTAGGQGNAKDDTVLVAATPAAGQVKGTDGPDWVLACVLLDVRAAIVTDARIGYGHCERMPWHDGRWLIAPGTPPAKAPSTWPGSDLALQAGWRTWRPAEASSRWVTCSNPFAALASAAGKIVADALDRRDARPVERRPVAAAAGADVPGLPAHPRPVRGRARRLAVPGHVLDRRRPAADHGDGPTRGRRRQTRRQEPRPGRDRLRPVPGRVGRLDRLRRHHRHRRRRPDPRPHGRPAQRHQLDRVATLGAVHPRRHHRRHRRHRPRPDGPAVVDRRHRPLPGDAGPRRRADGAGGHHPDRRRRTGRPTPAGPGSGSRCAGSTPPPSPRC